MEQLDPSELRRENCPIMKSVSLIGDKWVLQIMRECFLGFSKFDEFQTNLNVSKSVLSNKLQKMVAEGLLVRESYQKQSERTRYAYKFSRQGIKMFKVIVSLLEWGNEFLIDENEETILMKERNTSSKLKVKPVNEKGEIVEWRNVEFFVAPKTS